MMGNEINLVNESGQVVVSSREVAENFGKRHNKLVFEIERMYSDLTTQNGAVKTLFFEASFNHRGNTYKEYLMNRDGFSLLVMGFTGKEALQWKLKYIEAFNGMEKALQEQMKPAPFDLTADGNLQLLLEVTQEAIKLKEENTLNSTHLAIFNETKKILSDYSNTLKQGQRVWFWSGLYKKVGQRLFDDKNYLNMKKEELGLSSQIDYLKQPTEETILILEFMKKDILDRIELEDSFLKLDEVVVIR